VTNHVAPPRSVILPDCALVLRRDAAASHPRFAATLTNAATHRRRQKHRRAHPDKSRLVIAYRTPGFAEGIAKTILTRLAKIADLSATPRTRTGGNIKARRICVVENSSASPTCSKVRAENLERRARQRNIPTQRLNILAERQSQSLR